MAHENRARRTTNERRRREAAAKQAPLPLEEQQARAAERALLRAARYPSPPVYGGGYSRRPRGARDAAPALPFWLELMALSVKRGMRAAQARRGRKPR